MGVAGTAGAGVLAAFEGVASARDGVLAMLLRLILLRVIGPVNTRLIVEPPRSIACRAPTHTCEPPGTGK